MQDLVDELDLAVINALQIRPRATWAEVGRVLQVDAVTVARRWQRLADAGLAWVTCAPGSGIDRWRRTAYIELDVPSSALGGVAARLCREPRVYMIHHMTGEHPLLLTVGVAGPAALSRFIIDRIGTWPDVDVARVHMVTVIFKAAQLWRLRALGGIQRQELERKSPPRGGNPSARELTAADWRLIDALSVDGRASYSALAERAELTEPTARRRVNHLLASGQVALRCELAQVATGWPETAVMWISVQPESLENAARSAAAIPEIRASVTVSGPANLLLFAWLRDAADLPGLEELLVRRCPGITVLDRAVCLHTMKLAGHLLDDNGCSVGHVPMDFRGAMSVDEGAEMTYGRVAESCD